MTKANKILWTPSAKQIEQANLSAFVRQVEKKHRLQFQSYDDLHHWSVSEPALFWESIWQLGDIRHSQAYTAVLENAEQFPGARWFPGARLNFAENLLRRRDDKIALVSLLENGDRRELSYKALYQQVEQLADALRKVGVKAGDRVAGFMPNIADTVVAMLASTSLGAIWSSCSPDFGLQGVLDRFQQIEPTVLFAVDGYYYNGKTVDTRDRVQQIAAALPSLRQLIVSSVAGLEIGTIPQAIAFEQFLSQNPAPLAFEQLPFDHPLYILYSSGTTGIPKCIVHGAGGTLLQHIKEHRLHTDLNPGDVLFYFTTCGWMMWNWLVSALASECCLVLYDGSPFAGQGSLLLDAIDREGIKVFGTSAKFIASLEKAHLRPRDSHSLESLSTILSTGSPLSHESFEYVYRDIKADLCLSSISGGTDIISCFVLGNPCLPVYTGEIQCLGLGMAVEIWDENGHSLTSGRGELVCTQAFPSCPVGFWKDEKGERFHQAYFSLYPGVWAHGDFAERTPSGGVVIHGRSDAVLNPGGVRIGTAEIYRQVEKIDSVLESIVIGQRWEDDVRVVLFVVLREGLTLDDSLRDQIRQTIKANTTPRHVPAMIVQVAEIPRTISGKIVELAVRQVVHGEAVKNTDALANPQALENFRNLPELS